MSAKPITLESDIQGKMKDFPCAFNLETADKVTRGRLKSANNNICNELRTDDDSEEEIIRKKNMLTWILFRLDEEDKALEMNGEVLELTNWRNMASVGNRVFITLGMGDEIESKECLKKLEGLKEKSDLLTEARAEQAYYYSRLGGVYNLQLAQKLFTESISFSPCNWLWRYGLGLVYRRMTNTNWYLSSPEKLDVNEFKIKAAECLFSVGENDAVCDKLRGMAFGQLASLRQYHPLQKDNATFKGMNLLELCEMACKYGPNDPLVLTLCGRSLKSVDIDKSVEYLENSVKLRRNTIAYHHLGLVYEKKARLIAAGKYHSRPKMVPQLNARRQLFASENPRETRASTNQSVTTSTLSSKDDVACPNVQGPNHLKPVMHSGFPHPVMHSGRPHPVMHSGRPHPVMHSGWPRPVMHSGRPHPVMHSGRPHPVMHSGRPHPVMHSGRPHPQRNTPTPTIPFQRSTSCTVDFESAPVWSYYGNQRGNLGRSRSACNRRYQRPRTRSRGGGHGYNRSYSESDGKSEAVKIYIRGSLSDGPVNPNDELIKKALKCYDEAIAISAGENIPAILSKGTLLQKSLQLKEALTQFNKVTTYTDKFGSHRLSSISAYEQAGLCYLELHKTAEQPNTYYKDAQLKLTRAISLAANLASVEPELKNSATDLWKSFRVLNDERRKEPSRSIRNKALIQLLKLVRDYSQIVEAVGKMIGSNDEELDDPEYITSGIQSCLELKEFENALTFLNMASTRPSLTESEFWKSETMTDLTEKTLLAAVENRLRQKQGDAKDIFQQIFKFVYGQCTGAESKNAEDSEMSEKGDVLFVYDDSLDTVDEDSNVSISVRNLQDVFTRLFGVDNSSNLKACSRYSDVHYDIQLEWLSNYRVVILVIGHEDRLYEYFLKTAPYCTEDSTILVINTMPDTSKIPASLKSRPCLSLYEIDGFQATFLKEDASGGAANSDDVISRVFDNDTDAVMKLFRFLIGKD